MQKMEVESPTTFKEYRRKRSIIHKEMLANKYGNLVFTPQEDSLNTSFHKLLSEERSKLTPSFYRENTLKHVKKMHDNKLFKIIDKMPKGATLHIHLDCCYSLDFMMELTRSENCYEKNKRLYFRSHDSIEEGFISVQKQRESSGNIEKFDIEMAKSLQINEDDLKSERNIWEIFEEKILRISNIILYKENFYNHIINIAKGFLKEGIFHLEVRQFLNVITDEKGNNIGIDAEMELFRKATKEIQKEHPEFSFKIIVQGLKIFSLSEIETNLQITIKTAKDYPDLIVGYDLVMEEDKYKQMIELVEVLLKKDKFEEEYKIKLPFVFHGGESIKYLENSNLFDLILLKTKRIGHGLNLIKHSYLMDNIREKHIAIEINPLSNQLLDYVYDLRLHPGITFHNFGLKIVINPDDPGIFGSNYINYDFFVCALAMEFDLKDFKRICLNSIECSLLTEDEKNKAIQHWNKEWEKYISFLLDLKDFE